MQSREAASINSNWIMLHHDIPQVCLKNILMPTDIDGYFLKATQLVKWNSHKMIAGYVKKDHQMKNCRVRMGWILCRQQGLRLTPPRNR